MNEKINSLPALARATVEEYINTGNILNFEDINFDDYKNKQAGVFVTLHMNNNLRGCIGTISPTQDNIITETVMNAISASTRDPRFPQVSKEELPTIDYSVSLLMPPEPIDSIDLLNPDEYGVIVVSGHKRGLLLPRLESITTAEEQVFHAMAKAGIRQNETVELFRFQSIEHKE